jgi:hypothetical protein
MTAAGKYYPADPGELRNEVEKCVGGAGKVKVPGRLVALIAPHAGYQFSGRVAGCAYAALESRSFDTVVVVGTHFPGKGASVLDVDYYQTPLGFAGVDRDVVKKLLAAEVFNSDAARHADHAIETQVPFLQVVLPEGFRLVAIAATETGADFVKKAAQGLARALEGKRALLVASTDLAHFPSYEAANEIDAKIVESWKTLDGMKVIEREEALMREYSATPNLECVMCGKAAVAIVVEAAKLLGAKKLEILKYANSGDVPQGEKSQVVGYAAAAIFGETEMVQELSRDARLHLLGVAREAVTAAVAGKAAPAFEAKTAELKVKRGVFVTLYKNGRLRGCIGCFSSPDELPATVARYAVLSALEDDRFGPVKPDEVAQLGIKVSVLSEPRKAASPEEVEIGRHGIWIVDKRTGRSGTYLPEVATEMGWDRETFLTDCCLHKAGLPGDCWKKGAVDIFIYTTQVFGEGE